MTSSGAWRGGLRARLPAVSGVVTRTAVLLCTALHQQKVQGFCVCGFLRV